MRPPRSADDPAPRPPAAAFRARHPATALASWGRRSGPVANRPRRSTGFTLIEAVITIALTAIVASMVAVFMRAPITAYVDVARRAALTDAADLALRRIARELRQALPNSPRVDASGSYLEFLPVSDGGRYRAAPQADGSGDFLEFDNAADTRFDVLGPTVAVAAGDQLVIYNLGIPGADAYAGDTRRALSGSGSALASLTFTPGSGGAFPYASPGKRFQIVATPVSFVCAGGNLRRYARYAIQALQPVDVTAAPLATLTGANNALLTDSVSACSFSYASGALARNGVMTLRLTLASGGESVTLLQQVHVDNVP